MTSPSNLNEFAQAMDTEKEIYKKLTICEALVKYLKNPNSDISLDEQGAFCTNLIQWMASPSLKISLKALDAGLAVIERMPHILKPFVSSCFPALVERYADSKETVRTKVHQVFMAFLNHDILTPQALHDRLTLHGYHHKNSMVREESLKCLYNILVMYGASSLQLSSSTSSFLSLYCDPNEAVREEAATVLVEIYRQVGEKLRQSITKLHGNSVPPQRLAALFAKFDGVRDPDLRKFQAPGATLSRPESVEDVGDGATQRRLPPVSRIPCVNSSRQPSLEDLSKKHDVKKPYGTLGRSAAKCSASAVGQAGAVDEATFRAAFLDVPNVTFYGSTDLVDGIKTISAIIGSTDQDWEKRVDALKKVRSYTIAGCDHPDFLQLIKKLEIPIFESLKDLRSQVVREACITVAFLADCLKAKFAYFAEFIFPSLIALIQNSAKIMASSAQVALRFIVENTSSLRLISLTVNSFSSKSKDIRRALCEILCIMISTWPLTLLEKKHAEIRTALQKGVADADPEARQIARKAFCEYKSKFPERADDLLRSLDVSYRRMLSEGSTDSLNLSARSATPRKPQTSTTKKPVFNRSNTAVDAQAVQRAQVRAQYAAMHRHLAGYSGRPPPASSAMTNSTLEMSADESNVRSRSRVPRYSRSQPTSRSASPSPQLFNHQNNTRSIRKPTTPGPRSWASSVENSRETSPTRLGVVPKARRRLVATTPPPLFRPTTSQRMLQQSQEAEYALADAFMRTKTNGPQSHTGERSSDESETSSRASCAATPPHIQEISDIVEYLHKSEWSYKKEGLISLKYYLTDHSLGPEDLKKVTDVMARMFMDSHTKVYTLFLETLSVLIERHWRQLDSWLYILLHKLFAKLGTDNLTTIEKKILEVLSLVRETFPHSTLLKQTFRFLADPTQVHNTKVRLNLLKFLSQLTASGSKSSPGMEHLDIKETAAIVISKIVKWSEIVELRETANKCIADLFYWNAPLISSILPKLTQKEQVVVDEAVKKFLRPRNSMSPDKKEQDDVKKSLQLTSHEIQTYKFVGVSQDSGIYPMSPPSPPFEDIESAILHAPEKINNGETSSNEELSNSESIKSNENAWAKIFPQLQSDNMAEKLDAITRLRHLVRESSIETVSRHIGKILQTVVPLLVFPESLLDIEAINQLLQRVFSILTRLLKMPGLETHFAHIQELIAIKTLAIRGAPHLDRVATQAADQFLSVITSKFSIDCILPILHKHVLDKSSSISYTAIKNIENCVLSHSAEEFEPYFSETMTLLLVAFESEHSAVRKAVVFCLVVLYKTYGAAKLEPYFKKLDTSKKKLVEVYIQKSLADENEKKNDERPIRKK